MFTSHSEKDGSFGIGKLPNELREKVTRVSTEFYSIIPGHKKKDMTYHIWYDDFPQELQDLVQGIQHHTFWQQACRVQNTCVIRNISQMDELYYSRAPKQTQRGMLYGATGNYDLHVDGIFRFPGVRFYRVLIGLTNDNTTVETSFPRLESSIYINKDDYVIFDFDHAQHKVINHEKEDNDEFRLLLKLHFCVCETCNIDSAYFDIVCRLYVAYEVVTRYIMQTGTNPSSWYQFFFGLLSWFGATFPLLLGSYLALPFLYVILLVMKQPASDYIGKIILDGMIVFLTVVTLMWGRYVVFKVR